MTRHETPSLAIALAALAFCGAATTAFAGSTPLKQVGQISNPAGKIDGFDISFVDQKAQRYYLADRSNKSVDIVDTKTDKLVGSVGGFVGVALKPDGKPNNDISGPDGVIAIGNEVWAGDGDSTVKVIDLKSMKVVDTISTGGKTRVDEMAYDPKDHIFIGVNNAEEPPYATLVSTAKGHKVLGKVTFPDATDGAEQPAYNPADGKFYVAIPEIKENKAKGGVAVIDPKKATLVKILPVDNCHPAGLVVGAGGNLVLGCTANGKDNMPPIITVLNPKTGKVVKNIAEIGGADEVWYNAKAGQYYTGSRDMPEGPVLGVIDASKNALVQKIALKSGNPHSVAASDANSHVYVPQGSNGGGCGCILVFAPGK